MSEIDSSVWDSFCDNLKLAGQAIVRPECPDSDADRAEGYRYLLGLVHALSTRALQDPGPEHPAFVRGMDDVVKYGLDAPDGHNYYAASVREDLRYRIWGVSRPSTYVGWQVMGRTGNLHNCSLDEFELAADGSFEIVASQQRAEGNWIPLPPGATSIMLRQFHGDWAAEEYIEVNIATLDPQPGFGACVDNPTPGGVSTLLNSLGQNVLGQANFWVDFVHGFRAGGDNVAPPSIFNPSIGGSTSQLASNGCFDVAKGQVLLISFTPPEARYWSVCLGNFWFQTIDLHHHQSSLNGAQAHLDDDGVCRIVLSHTDPGVANWLDPFDHTFGTITFRWLLAAAAPEVTMALIPAEELPEHLPASTRRLTATERDAVLAVRRAEVAKRFSMPATSRWFTSAADPAGTTPPVATVAGGAAKPPAVGGAL